MRMDLRQQIGDAAVDEDTEEIVEGADTTVVVIAVDIGENVEDIGVRIGEATVVVSDACLKIRLL